MITSNEPGYYVENEFGIRHENLIVCKKAEKTAYGQFMCFEMCIRDRDLSKFYRFHEVLEKLFPNIHRVCEKHEFNGSLLFKWKGKGQGEPILFMSHQDVVEASGAVSYTHLDVYKRQPMNRAEKQR